MTHASDVAGLWENYLRNELTQVLITFIARTIRAKRACVKDEDNVQNMFRIFVLF